MGGVLGLVLVQRSRRRQSPLLPTFRRVPAALLVTFVLACVGVAIAALIDGPSKMPSADNSKFSGVALDLTVAVTCLEWAVIFGWALWQRWSAADQSSASDQRQVQGG